MHAADKDTIRLVRKELVRHALDTNETQISVMRGLVHLYGRIRPLPGREADFDSEVNSLFKALKARPEISNVLFEWEVPGKDATLPAKKTPLKH